MSHASSPGSPPAFAAMFLGLLLITNAQATSTDGASIDIPDLGSFRIGEACIHDNLAIYPVYAEGEPRPEMKFITLAEALKRNKIKVKETGIVNRLTIRNLSDSSVFIQAGDIVRGGRQDRMIAHDLVLASRSERIPIDAFCVESGRWSRRGVENSGEFGSSSYRAISNTLTLAARDAKSQAGVWQAVFETQTALSEAVETEVRDHRSPTSMELTLDNPRVRDAAAVGDFMWIPSRVKGKKRKIVDGIAEHRQSFGPAIRFITRDDRLGWVHAEVLFGF